MKRLLLTALLTVLLALPIVGASASRTQTEPDENGCFRYFSGLNRTGTVICIQVP